MSEYFQPFIDLVTANPEWAGVFIFLMATFETIVAFGYIIPGTWLMLSFGVFVGTGVLRFDVVFVAPDRRRHHRRFRELLAWPTLWPPDVRLAFFPEATGTGR